MSKCMSVRALIPRQVIGYSPIEKEREFSMCDKRVLIMCGCMPTDDIKEKFSLQSLNHLPLGSIHSLF